MKRVLSVLLAVLLIAAALPLSAAADSGGFVMEDHKITAYNGPGGDVVIPNDAASIASDVFTGRSDITSITFPKYALTGYTQLDLTGCTSLDNFYVDAGNSRLTSKDGLLCDGYTLRRCPPARTEVTIPANITYFDPNAFDSCTNLERFLVEQGNTKYTELEGALCEIPQEGTVPLFVRCPPAFQGEFSFPDGLSLMIGDGSFKGCSGITKIYIPANVSVPLAGLNYFSDCTNLEHISVSPNHPKLFTRDNLLFLRQEANNYQRANKLLTCPAGYQGALTLPEDIDFDYASNAFVNCSGLTELTMSRISNFIEYDFFKGCDSLASLHYNPNGAGADPADEAAEVDGVLYIGQKGNYFTLVAYPPARTGDFTVPNTVQYIGRNAFRGRAISSVTIPATVKNIWQDTFRDCPNLTKVDIAPMAIADADPYLISSPLCNCGLREISSGAFQNCPNLSYVYIPETTGKIGSNTGQTLNIFTDSPNVTIYGAAGSKAQEYANQFGIPFNAVSLPSRPSDLPSASPSPTPTNKPTPTPKPTPKPDNRPTVGGFTDVHQGDYYANAVAWALENGITSGAAKDKFGVGSPCKREQIATFLWRANNSPEASKTASFADMTNNQVFNQAISWAVEQGITSGVGNNKFGVGQTCTRVQAVTFLWIAAGKPTPEKQAAFDDMTNNPVFNNAISWAVENGITSGTGNNKFSPNKPCTREQIVTFLYNAYK